VGKAESAAFAKSLPAKNFHRQEDIQKPKQISE